MTARLLTTAFTLLTLTIPTVSFAMNLKETIEDAIIHNPQFRQQVKAYRAVQAEVRGAKGGYYPSVDLAGGIGYEEVNNPTVNNEGDGLTRREASVRVTQNLFQGFGTEYEVSRQKYRLDAAAYKAESAANDIALEMATAYINLLREKETLKLAQDNLDTHTTILDQIVKRQNAGIGNQVEVDQARARLALAHSNLGSAQNNYYDAEAKFNKVLGRQPDNLMMTPKFVGKPLPSDLEKAIEIAMREHPTLKSANSDIAAARAQYQSSKQNYYPSVDLEIEKTFDENLGGIKGENEYLQAMLRVRYNLYNGGRDRSEKKRSASEYSRAAEIRNNTRRQVIENLKYAWNANQYIGSQLTYVNQHIKMTHETLVGYRKQFSLGRRSLLDLLNTENEYVSALRTLINSESDQLIAKYRILAAMGKLLPTLNIQYDFIQAENDHANE